LKEQLKSTGHISKQNSRIILPIFLNFTGLSSNSHCSHVVITDRRKLKVQSWVG